jgi:hypothetical protein
MPSPVARMQYYDKNEKKAYEIASLFDSQHHEWKTDVSTVKSGDAEHRFPKMTFMEAGAREFRKEGYISVTWPKTQQPDRQQPAADSNDIPF